MTPQALPQAVAVAAVCVATLAVGAIGLRLSRTTSDFYVASRAVSPAWNASAIGGEYLSAASFLGIAGLVLAFGSDMLWYPVGYTAGYLVLLLLVAAPLRRSGAYTLPDFAEIRFGSTSVRRVAAVLVVAIGWLYLLPQFQGAGLALRTVTGTPAWVGSVIVAGVVVINVAAGGMRSITFVQAFQYWLKLTAIAIPVFFMLAVWHADGSPWPVGMPSVQPRDHSLYRTYSLLLALLFGTMGLPHVLVRFYTNPDGRAARRTTLVVLGLLGMFYLFPPVYGVLGRLYAPDLFASGQTDVVTLLLPGRVVPGPWGTALSTLVTAGAFAAFLSTASGLTISVAGVLSQDLLRGRLRATVTGFRVSALLAVTLPTLIAMQGLQANLADTVGLAFAVAASTFCPLLVLGIWWPRLTARAAVWGLAAGGTTATAAVVVTMAGGSGEGALVSGFAGALLAQPAAWTVPIAFGVMIIGSLLPGRPPSARAWSVMIRLHAPERVQVDRGRRHGRPSAATARPTSSSTG